MKRGFKVALAIAALILMPMLLLPAAGIGAEDELSAISNTIQHHGANWVAGETSMSRLSPAARKKRLGALKPLLAAEEHKAALEERAALAAVVVPASFNWRAATGGNYVTPVRDQGNCGSCWAFAATAAAESQVLIGSQSPGTDINLSEQTLVACSNAGNCGGGYPNGAADFVRDMGLPLESCFPYTAANSICKACSGWTNGDYHITGWHWAATSSPTVAGLKAALCTYGPLTTTMDVYDDFFYYRGGVYKYTSGGYAGGHAVLIVGYDDPGQYFIVKNSWGSSWGEAGYFKIAYSQLTSRVYFGEYTIAFEGYNPTNPPPPSCTYALSPASKIFHYTGGTAYVTVSSQASCSWTTVSNDSWITITSGSTGTGSRKVGYKVAANRGAYRTGTVTIAGQTFTVKQYQRGK